MIRKLFCLAFLVFTAINIHAQVQAQYRGPYRDGYYPDQNLLTTWPATGPALLWSNNEIGNGYGPPAITDNRVYVTGEIDSIAYLFAFSLQGQFLWKTDFGKEWTVSYPGSRSTPTVVGNLIYVSSGLGNLYCIEAADGAKKWSLDMKKDLHGRFTVFGHAESPLVEGDRIFYTPGGIDTNVVALNRFTGKIEWICKAFGEPPAYNSPILIKLPTFSILVTFSAYHMLGIDAATGKLLWSHEQINTPVAERKSGMGDTHSNSAFYENGYIYYFAGDGNCGVKLKLSEDGMKVSQEWRNTKVDNYMGGFIKLGNRIFVGCEGMRSLLTVDANTGQILDSLKILTGSIAFADNMIYFYNQRGEMNLVNPGIVKPELISSFKITAGTKEHFSHPVIRDGKLYIRRGKALLAYDIRKK